MMDHKIFNISTSFQVFYNNSRRSDVIKAWTSEGLSEERINAHVNSLAAVLTYIHNAKTAVKFDRGYLEQDKAKFTHRKVAHLFIVYGLDMWSRNSRTDFLLLFVWSS